MILLNFVVASYCYNSYTFTWFGTFDLFLFLGLSVKEYVTKSKFFMTIREEHSENFTVYVMNRKLSEKLN